VVEAGGESEDLADSSADKQGKTSRTVKVLGWVSLFTDASFHSGSTSLHDILEDIA